MRQSGPEKALLKAKAHGVTDAARPAISGAVKYTVSDMSITTYVTSKEAMNAAIYARKITKPKEVAADAKPVNSQVERDDAVEQHAALVREQKEVDKRIARLVAAVETAGD